MSSELKKLNNSKNLIICFGGMALKMGGIIPFEFLKYLNFIFKDDIDTIFYIDKNQCHYHKGIDGITPNINETVAYLNLIISNKYEKVIFMGVSAGGYAAILFGSLCKVSQVIAFIPQTILSNPIYQKYKDLKNFIEPQTKYIIYGDISIKDINNLHNISHCNNLREFNNVEIIEKNNLDMKILCYDTDELKLLLYNIFNNNNNLQSNNDR